MRKLLLFVTLSLFVFIANAQKYRFFNDDYSVYKSDLKGYYYPNQTINIDTFGAVYQYEFQTMVNNSNDPSYYSVNGIHYCNVNGAGFLGQYVHWDTSNNVYHFHNRWNDTIKIFTTKPQGYSWIAYEKDTTIVIAYISNIEIEMLNETPDTIKTVSFECEGVGNQYNVSSENIVISSQRGLIQACNIGSFPYLYDFYVPSVFLKVENTDIIDKFNPTVIDSISKAQIYNLNVHDELHIVESFRTVNIFDIIFRKTTLRVLRRDDDLESISLTYYKKYKEWKNGNVINQFIDTIQLKYSKNPLYGMPPYRYEGTESYCILRNLSLWINRIRIYEPFGSFEKVDESIWEFVHGEGFIIGYGILGLGDGYYAGGIFGDEYRELVYYNVSGQEWGTPLNFTVGVNDIELESLKVFPNPVKDRLIINSSNLNSEADLMIFDMSGKTIMNRKIQQRNNQIELDVSNLDSGVYTIQISSGQKMLTNKFIKLN